MAATKILFGVGLSLVLFLFQGVAAIDYGQALTKSLLFYEAQRSGKLPRNQRVAWRANSGLKDGSDAGIDLVGGYYDAGDNVKFGFPMAFTTTMLAWSAVDFGRRLEAKRELVHTLEAIKWATDYMIKAHPHPDVLYGEIGDGNSDHACWQRPEEMSTPRTSYKIDANHPGSDLAGETAAALAAASIAFSKANPSYARILITHAKQLFDFARNHQGIYQFSIPIVGQFYSSSGFQDELLWAAAWLHRATGEKSYLDYLGSSGDGGTKNIFSWDDKYVGAQVLVAKLVLEGKVPNHGAWAQYKTDAEAFVCSVVQKGNNNIRKTPGGLLWFNQAWNPLQYTSSAAFITVAYSDFLADNKAKLQCPGGVVNPVDLIRFVQSQVDYILGVNPKRMSYMVGYGATYPQRPHHRGASIVSIKKDSTVVTCNGGFVWLYKDSPNPNVLDGAIVGGPNEYDAYDDARTNYQQCEPTTVNTAPLVGVLARLSA